MKFADNIFSPLAGRATSLYTNTSSIYEDPLFTLLESKYGISPGTIILSWLVQRGVIVIPHSSSPTRLAQNRQLAKLDEDDIQSLNSFHEKVGRELIIEKAPIGWVDTPDRGRTFMGWNTVDLGWFDNEGNCLT